ncbi:heme exporter protein CcmB [Yunchengibacter salinarum]|uniref:heme exporter protein CcmB n=1 Tax=Yunchengibacter salinarum TaxID=3133399 RepID=UPI0035B59FE9
MTPSAPDHSPRPGLMRAIIALIRRDVALAWSEGGAAGLVLGFFLVAVSLFPFGIGPAPQLLARMAPGIVWVVALMAAVVSLDRLYQVDFEDGTLDQVALSPVGMTGVVLAKTAAHWLGLMLPLALMTPLLGAMLGLSGQSLGVLLLGFLIGSPALSLIGGVGASLTVAVRRGGVLIALLVLPLTIPTLIFAVGAVDASANLQAPVPHLALLGATSLLAALVSIPASVLALKLALE